MGGNSGRCLKWGVGLLRVLSKNILTLKALGFSLPVQHWREGVFHPPL